MAFRLAPVAAGKKQRRPSVWPAFAMLGVLVAGALFVTWLAGRRHTESELDIDPRPVILSLQKLGDLHTARMNMKDVLRQSSAKEAEGWARAIPGLDAATQWATHNEALVVAQGSVEAGVNLSQISPRDVTSVRQPDGKTLLRIHLPPVTIYPPQVRVQVENTQAGLLWRDENLVPKAEEEAGRRFVAAAEQDRIRDRAQENAIQTLQQMEKALGHDNVEFTF